MDLGYFGQEENLIATKKGKSTKKTENRKGRTNSPSLQKRNQMRNWREIH